MELSLVNLEDLNLVELNPQEVQEVEGGILPIILGCISIVGAGYYAGEKIGRALYYATN
ncbi:class IIb bacteriocin, lactobin A/cerein 7B family [Flavobacterium sp. TAB 87]|uniref:class IIb bacteriocin, lactobin A/cerein 7B family n=1 Tax=Flavobacterium sp. TAB 87 TaxID=1729581 RepID=UPI00076D4F9A|nr:class IIb bacteriocin, lactobin A/cerein 7B family [Flavobacterium sp. TAB 87]KVV13586.1 class IIb bacteriocin, lactobin A/cerein 7B family [Flavobacterium sp. TAB 87]